MKLKSPFAIFSPLKRVGYRLLLALGVGVAVFFIAFSLLVNVQTLAVLLASIGAALGVLIASLVFPKILVASNSQREKLLSANLSDALRKRAALAADIERLKSQQLQIQQVQQVLKLTLLEVDTVLTDYKTSDLGAVERPMGGTESHRYVGVLRKHAKVMLGIDLANLRVKEEAGVLFIDGLRAQFQGVSAQRDEWLQRYVEVSQDNLVFSNKTLLVRDDARLFDATAQHSAELSERMQNGVEVRAFDAALERMGEQWLRAMLAPMGMAVRIAAVSDGSNTPFVDYLNNKLLALYGTQHQLEASVMALEVQTDKTAHKTDSDVESTENRAQEKPLQQEAVVKSKIIDI